MRWADRFGDWLNRPLWGWVRYIDIWIAFGGVICVGWYWLTEGWFGVLKGVLAYVFMCMIGLWFLR